MHDCGPDVGFRERVSAGERFTQIAVGDRCRRSKSDCRQGAALSSHNPFYPTTLIALSQI